jgi:osmotically-inducible protein OsmY
MACDVQREIDVETEASLVKRIRAAFEHEARINLHRHPVRISVEGDAVVLEGEVENIAVKKTALGIAAATPGVTGLVDRLRIARPTRMTDAEIRGRLRDTLQQEPAFRDVTLLVGSPGRRESIRKAQGEPYAFIDAAVDDGVVTLNGQLPSLSHKRLAGVLAWWIPGTRDVVNGMEVVPDQVDNDDEITDAVRLVLEKDRLVDETEIRAHTRNRVVTLEGLVPNGRIREMAEIDAWLIFGVDGVVNRLELQATSPP